MGVGHLVYRLPPDRDSPIFRNFDVFREDSVPKAEEIYADNRKAFTTPGSGESWKLYREQDTAAEKWFMSYHAAHFATNHGMPMWWDNSPDIHVGVLKRNVFIEIAYSAYFPSWDWNYTRTINKDFRFAADVLSKAVF